MKNMMKAMICALTVSAAMAAVPAVVSARDDQSVYTCDSYTLILREQASYDAPITLWVEDAYGYELHVEYYLNGFGYCYVPALDANGWVDLEDAYYEEELDVNEVLYGSYYDDDYDYDYDYGYYDYEDDFDYDYYYTGWAETRYSYVDYGFLALRYLPIAGDDTIIAQIYTNGTELWMTGEYNGNYGYCYVPAFDMYGWVDVRYTF